MTATSQAQPARVHPRRRPVLDGPLPSLATDSSVTKMQLKKGETFHTPTSPPADERDPVLNIRSLPHRSPTSLDSIAITEQKMASILERLTLDCSDEESGESASSPKDFFPPDVLEAGVEDESRRSSALRRPSLDGDLPSPAKETHDDHDHESDSGLGTSVSSCEALSAPETRENKCSTGASVAFDVGPTSRPQLNLTACKQIERYILVPILREPKLRPFHPLIQSIPTRIVNRKIVCLRDLEKCLLWVAPFSHALQKFASSHLSYLNFSEFTIQCLHSAASHLNDREQRLPTDRPYTNGYFLDLVEQVRRYAAMIRASRERAQQGQDANAANKPKFNLVTDAALEGGLSKNGKPAELVVMQDGKPISMATGLPYAPGSPIPFKRAISFDEAVDEGVQRSMARRKKNAPPMDINQKCSHCDKVFKRPCDLTKHEKTHSRPWKCTEPTCKYYQVGWPTEKERDRHLNDKHSDAPPLFTCKFQPCTYASKRLSNCKQHMEKAHGWVYVRSKNNTRGGSKRGSSLQATPGTPSVSTPASKSVDFSTPMSGPSPSSREPSLFPENLGFNFADPPLPARSDDYLSLFDASSYPTSSSVGNDFGSLATSVNLDTFQAQFEAGDPNSLIPALEMHRQSMNTMSIPSAESVPELMPHSMSFDGSPLATTDNNSLNFDYEWSHLDLPAPEDYTVLHMVPTPAHSDNKPYTVYPGNMGPPPLPQYSYGASGKLSGLSPGAQGHLTLYSPDSGAAEERLSDHYEYGIQPQTGNDFTLYEASSRLNAANLVPAVNRYQAVSQYAQAQAQTMFPPLQDRDLQGIQSWPEQRRGSNSDSYAPTDMDLEFMK
ncbi:Zinc finger C2H2 [Penicillium hispanicum]|uniref:Zinc finger C2H2 n=1 Tax=Penicillium hispanicum TaxID=1080232 RepID=UPI002540AC21|nr:Zinc finger C2H2 [Penicillium hispanicum]KAJ5594059.1 Zinc finger C2H2 [Penicillium hispanicum]